MCQSRWWSDEDIRFLIHFKNRLSIEDIAKELGRKPCQIRSFYNRWASRQKRKRTGQFSHSFSDKRYRGCRPSSRFRHHLHEPVVGVVTDG